MGQQEVYEFLAENPGDWYTSREIARALGISIGSVTMSLKKLRKTNTIAFKSAGVRNTFHYSMERPRARSAKAPV